MEAAYDKNSTNSAFDNDSSHFKFNNMDDGLKISADMPVPNDSQESQTISLSATLKQSYNDSNDAHNLDDETSGDVVDNNQRFEDDFGPETDVDGLDDAHATKSPIEFQANNNISDFNLSNGVKSFSLENKIIQHLSEQNVDFLADSNPFKDENCEQYHDQHALDSDLLDEMVTENGRTSPEVVVDNKIIDALESFGVPNGEKEKHEIEDGEDVSETTDVSRKLPEIQDFSEKADCSHEKKKFPSDLEADQPTDEFIHHHSTNMFDQHMDQETSQDELAHTPTAPGTGCVEGSIGEESEEEDEDEWNYFKGDKKTEEQSELTVNKEIPKSSEADRVEPPHQQEDEAREPLVEPVQISDTNREAEKLSEPIQPKDTNLEAESLLCNFTAESSVEEESVYQESEKVDETKKETADEVSDDKEDLLFDPDLDKQQEEAAVLTEKESANTEERGFSDPLVDEASLIAACLDQPSVCEEKSAECEPILSEQETLCAELVKVEGANQNRVEEATDAELDTSIDEELQRPNSLSFEMASKLNPEAKEFVPTGSPTRSDPTSPVSNIPSALHNSYLLISDDTVIAQSPKKGTNTMDNIDVPAEDDFQHEMNNRPHELEKSEYTNGNGNADATARSHSPGSEPSYQELNLKEAMQCDEKLECEYNDEKQTATEESSSEMSNEKNLLNMLGKEQNAMNMSFYEGRDEALLSNNSDELNKVQMLSDEEEVTEPNSNGAEQVQLKTIESFEGEHVSNTDNLLAEKKDTVDYTISAVATQVVNDIAALVDQMQIEEPLMNMNDVLLSKNNADLFEFDANPVEVSADTVELNAGLVESSSDTVGSSSDLVGFENDPVGLNVASVDFSSDPIGFDSKPVELSVEPVEFTADPIAFKADLVEFNVDTLESKADLVEFNVDTVESTAEPTACMTEDVIAEQQQEFLVKAEGIDTIINLEKENEEKHVEDEVEEIAVRLQYSELDYPNRIEVDIASPTVETTAIETDELTSPIVEMIQQEVTAENEFMMDESVLNVPSPTQTVFETETSAMLVSAPSGIVEEPHVKDSALLSTNDFSSTEQITEKMEDVVSALVIHDTTSTVPVETISTPSIGQVANELKSPVDETAVLAPAVILATESVSKAAGTKTATSKTISGPTKSAAKIPATSADKKPTTTSKLLTKPTTKPMSTVKSAPTAIKKPSTVTSTSATATSTKTTTVSKSTTATTTTRPSVTSSASSKATVEKKAPLAAKKSLTAAVNGDLKVTPAARKPLTSTVKSTASVRSTTTTSSSTSSTTARPSSTSAKPTAASKPMTTTTRPTPSAPVRTSSASTRTSAALPTAKPRTTPLTANKTAGTATTTATSTVTSKTSQVSSAAKRMSSVQSVPKPAASTVTKMNVAPKSSSVNSRTSTVPKPSSTPAALRKSSTTPNKKPLSSPASKTAVKASPPGKPAPIKAPVPKLIETVSVGDETKNLMDLDKQLKNDNNQLITKNGIESQMIVIDSAAD